MAEVVSKRWSWLLFAVASLFVFGCGSGGGSSSGDSSAVPASYNGVTTQAVIDETNAEDLALGAYEGGEFQSELGMVSTLEVKASPSYVLVLAEALEDSLRDAGIGEPTMSLQAVVYEEYYSLDGSCGGRMTYSYTAYSDNTFDGSLDYQNYCNDGLTLNGGINYSGSYNPEAETVKFTLTWNTLAVSGEGTEAFTASGSMTMETSSTTSPGGGTFTMDMVLTDDATGETYWLDDYSLTVTPGTEFDTALISGRYYHPVHGYVDITTPTPLQISTLDGVAEAGELLFEGAEGTYVLLTFTGGGAYTVENQNGAITTGTL